MKKRTQVNGRHLTYRSLWTGADYLHRIGSGTEEGSFYPLLASALFRYLAFEGFLNHVGEIAFPLEWENEKAFFSSGRYTGTMGKLWFLADDIGLEFDCARRPYQTLKALHARRNYLAHPRTETWDDLVQHSTREQPRRDPELHGFADAAFLSRVEQDVSEIANAVLAGLRAKYPDVELELPRDAFRGALYSGAWWSGE